MRAKSFLFLSFLENKMKIHEIYLHFSSGQLCSVIMVTFISRYSSLVQRLFALFIWVFYQYIRMRINY